MSTLETLLVIYICIVGTGLAWRIYADSLQLESLDQRKRNDYDLQVLRDNYKNARAESDSWKDCYRNAEQELRLLTSKQKRKRRA